MTCSVCTALPASVMTSALAVASRSGSSASSAAKPSAAFRVGTTRTRLVAISDACRAARTTLGLFGSSRISSAAIFSTASNNSPVEGLLLWPPWTTAATPYESNIRASPSPAATATMASGTNSVAVAGAPDPLGPDDPLGPEPAATSPTSAPYVPRSTCGRPSWCTFLGSRSTGAPTTSAALFSRTSFDCASRFSTVMRVSEPIDSPRAIT